MSIKLKGSQPRENVIFTVKELSDAYDSGLENETIFYFIQDLNIATAQGNHNNFVKALNGLKRAIDTQDLNDLSRLTYRLLGMVDMD